MAECASIFCAYIVYQMVGLKKSFIFCWSLGLIGMVCLLIYSGDDQFYLSAFIISAKFGVSACFAIAYMGTQAVFPIQAVVFCFGTCAAIGHISAIFAPEVAELEPNSIAKCAFIFGTIIAIISILFLRLDTKKKAVAH